jgi:hypothetical protein
MLNFVIKIVYIMREKGKKTRKRKRKRKGAIDGAE